MSVINIGKYPATRCPELHRDVRADGASTYQDALARAMALAPLVRSERAAYERIPPVMELRTPSRARRRAVAGAIVAAGAGWALLATGPVPLAIALGAAFGLGAGAAGDRLGASLCTWRESAAWAAHIKHVPRVLTSAIEATVLCFAAGFVAHSILAGAGLALLAGIATRLGYAARLGVAAAEAHAVAGSAARRNVAVAEDTVSRAIAALRAAHAADLARLSAELRDDAPRAADDTKSHATTGSDIAAAR
jgi:hypothetical protein